ncbi:phosphatase PAP2 family protein [Clostridium sp. JN-1]|uniref:phosphatase PAP2 family protein n=1 Tax=Clostridium sp. JN-1 TaxID=2483110 RepID=UPI000F0B0CBA|nr:phosphatase PAP2 family protein [Clostridium sp. JN-1]
MKKLKYNLFDLSFMLLIPIVNVFYICLGNSSRGVHYMITDMDMKIPFIKLFAVPYLMWYPFMFLSLVYFCFYYKRTYYKVLFSIIFGLITSYIIYYFFQTTVPRPELYGNDILTNLVRLIYKTDKPYNCFPSIHVLTCYLVVKGTKDIDNKFLLNKILLIFMAFIIIISTQFTKQHVIFDLIFAIVQGEIIYRIVSLNLEKSLAVIKNQPWIAALRRKLEI